MELKTRKTDVMYLAKKWQSAIYIITGITIILFLFSDVLETKDFLYFNDFVVPISESSLDAYLSNLNSISLSGNLRYNFFNEVIPLLFLKLLAIFVPYTDAVKLFFMSFLIIPFIISYNFLKKVSGDGLLSFSLGLFSVLNLWFYDRLYQGHIFYYLFFFVFAVPYIYFLFFSDNQNKYLILGILFSLSFLSYYHYAIILVYITIIKAILDIAFEKNRLFKLIISYSLIGLTSLFLLLPFILFEISTYYQVSSFSSATNDASLAYFAAQSTVFSVFGLLRMGMGSFLLVRNNLPIYIIIFVTIIGVTLYLSCIKNKKNINNIKLMIVVLILSFLSFGYWINQDLLKIVYEYVPMMAIYRDMNKFVGIEIILLCFLLASNIYNVKKSRIYIISALIIAISIIPYSSGFSYFSTLNNDLLYEENDPGLYNIVTFPSYPMIFKTENNKFFHQYLPQANSFSMKETIYLPYPYQGGFKSEAALHLFEDIYTNKLSKESLKSRLNNLSVKYIYYYKNFDFKTNDNNYDIWYKKIDPVSLIYNKYYENEEIIIYKNDDYKPLIYSTGAYFRRLNPTKYNIYIENLKESKELFFLGSFSKEWKLYLISHPNNSWCKPLIFHDSVQTTECEHTQQFVTADELFNLWKEPLFNDTHKIINEYANGWTIDPDYIKKNYPKESYTENPDGSINIEMILFFKSQSDFNNGFIISGLTSIAIIIYFVRNRKRNKK